MIELRLDRASGVAPYRQIVQQVRAGVRLGQLAPGDRLPTAEEAVAQLGINRNTVVKAYHELKRAGLVTARRGRGTFIAPTLETPPATVDRVLQQRLERWLKGARSAGLDDESIRALISTTLGAAAGSAPGGRDAPRGSSGAVKPW